MTTTEQRLAALAQRPKRDKFPARSARILTAGLSAAAILGLSTTITAMSPPQSTTPTDSDVSPELAAMSLPLPDANVAVNPNIVQPPGAAVAVVQPMAPAPDTAASPAAAAAQQPTRIILEAPAAQVYWQPPSARSGGSS